MKQISEDEHIAKVREMFVELPHPVIGKMKVNGCPIKLMDTKPEIKTPAPTLGQNNEMIFGQLGYSNEEIQQWIKDQII